MNKKNTENYLENKGCGFTQISNKFIQNNKISNTAKAVYIYMASRPDGWEFHVNEIRNNVKSGREAINNAMNELIDFGYLIKSQIRCKLGKFNKNHYKILYQPLTENPLTENPLTVEPLTENQTLNNTDINNTDINNKKKKYIKKDGVLDTLPFSDQNELQGNLSKHSEIEPSFPETKGKSPKADKVENKQNLMVSKQVEQSPKVNGYSQDFLEFWNLYPVKGSNNGGAATKGSKKTAYKAWLKAFKDNNNLTLNEIKIGLQNYAKFLYGCSESGQQPCFQGNKHASTWINASGWEDEYTTTTSRATIRNPEQAMYEEAFEGLDEIMRRERESAEVYETLRGMRSV
jgi:predicted transcriptional regulator